MRIGRERIGKYRKEKETGEGWYREEAEGGVVVEE